MKLGDFFEDEFGGETPEDKSDSEAAAHIQSDKAQQQNAEIAQKLKTIKILLKAKAFSKAEVLIAKLEKAEEERSDSCCENPEVYWCKVLLKYKASSGEELIKMMPDLENDEDFALAMGFSETDEQLQYFTSITEEISKAKHRAAEEERLRLEEEARQQKIREEQERMRKEEEERQRKIQEEQERLRLEEEKAKVLKDCEIKYGVLIKYNGNDCDLIIPDIVTSIGEGAFYYCKSLISVTIPDSVTSIGKAAFRCCESLISVTIPDSVTSIGKEAFQGCEALTSVTIGNSVTFIGDWAFSYCTSLTSITIPDKVTSIRDFTFYRCTSLTNITIPNSVTSIGNAAFDECSSLTSVTIPNSVRSLGYSAFYGCKSLTSITIPNSVTSIDHNAFSGCTSLTNVYFKNTKGWHVGILSCTIFNSSDLSNASTAAKYLKDEYYDYRWERY